MHGFMAVEITNYFRELKPGMADAFNDMAKTGTLVPVRGSGERLPGRNRASRCCPGES